MNSFSYRFDSDSMGKVRVRSDALYGASTKRALDNFKVSGRTLPISFYKAMALIKFSCAEANHDLGRLNSKIARAIMDSALDIFSGKHLDYLIVDIYQTGSGTSTNMNVNEVIANLANLTFGARLGSNDFVHPNDHVNLGQSSNDVFPSAIHVSVYFDIVNNLLPRLAILKDVLGVKSDEFKDIVKSGRTHLQDATPVTLGQEFSGFARQIELAIQRIRATLSNLSELAIGGTAVGTGINTHKDFAKKVCVILSKKTGLPFREAINHFEAQGAKDTCVEVSSALKVLAVSLIKIANDIRWLSSGPSSGIAEITIPPVQPGSSIMPAKVNPVIAESVCQVATKVISNDLAITLAGQSGNFQLNVMMPLIADSILESIMLLSNGVNIFTEKCIYGIKANKVSCRSTLDKNLILSTALTPILGYDKVSMLTKEAYKSGIGIRDIVLKKGLMPEDELDRALDYINMTRPGF